MARDEPWEVAFERELAVARAADDIEAGQRLVMMQWWRIVGELDAIDRRWAKMMAGPTGQYLSSTPRIEARAAVLERMREILRRFAQWPEAAIGLLDHRDLKQWRPLLIGLLAAHPAHRQAMVERAFKVRKVRRGRFEIAQEFISVACVDRDLDLLRTTERLLEDLPDGIEPVIASLIAAYAVLGDRERMMALTLQAITAGISWPFFELLRAGHIASVPSAFIEALATARTDMDHAAMVAELRQAGHPAAAAVLAEYFADPIDRLHGELDRAAHLVHIDPSLALDMADVAVHRVLDSGRLPPGFDQELAGFLRRVPLTATNVERVLDLAGLIIARPVREEIAANVACSLVLAGDARRARRLLASMTSEIQRKRVLTLLGDI
jgi:hypothetical protein